VTASLRSSRRKAISFKFSARLLFGYEPGESLLLKLDLTALELGVVRSGLHKHIWALRNMTEGFVVVLEVAAAAANIDRDKL
jgi:hypothetical protein